MPFMSKVAVRSNLTLWVTDITTAHDRGLRYVLGLVFLGIRLTPRLKCVAILQGDGKHRLPWNPWCQQHRRSGALGD